MSKVRNSRSEVFCKKGVLTNFTKFTGKQLWQRLFFKKVAGLNACNFNKKNLCHRCFPVNFVRFLRIPFIIEHLWWLLLQGYLNFWQKPWNIRVNKFISRTCNFTKDYLKCRKWLTLLKKIFLGIFQGFCLKVSKGLFYRTTHVYL